MLSKFWSFRTSFLIGHWGFVSPPELLWQASFMFFGGLHACKRLGCDCLIGCTAETGRPSSPKF